MSEPPSEAAAAPRTALAVLLVVFAWAAAGLPSVANAPLDKASKARAWSVARTMARGGDLLVPAYNDEPRLKKPPLQSWVQSGTMAAVSSTDLRWAAFASWAVGILFALGPLLIGSALGRPVAGLLGSLALCASRATEVWGGSPEHDVPFAGWVALALAFLARALSPSGRARDSAFAGLAAGAAVLTKGPFAFAFVWGTALVATLRTRRRPEPHGRVRWVLLVSLTLLPSVLWLAGVWIRLGSVGAVFDEMRRQALGEGGAHLKSGIVGWLYYLGEIPKESLPWIVPGAIALLALSRPGGPIRMGSDPKHTRPPGRELAFAWIALAVAFVSLTLTPAKQPHYVLSALPPLFLVFGGAFEDACLRWPKVARLGVVVAFGCGVLVLAGRMMAVRGVLVVTALTFVGAFSWVLLALLSVLLAIRVVAVPAWRGAVVGLALASVALGSAGYLVAVAGESTDDYRAAAARIEASAWNRPVVGLAAGEREAFDTLMAWPDRPWTRVRDVDAVRARLDRGDAFLLLVPEPEKPTLAPVEDRLRFVRGLAPDAWKDAKDVILVYESR